MQNSLLVSCLNSTFWPDSQSRQLGGKSCIKLVHRILAGNIWIIDADAVGVIDLQFFCLMGLDDYRNGNGHQDNADAQEPRPHRACWVHWVNCLQSLLADVIASKRPHDLSKILLPRQRNTFSLESLRDHFWNDFDLPNVAKLFSLSWVESFDGSF